MTQSNTQRDDYQLCEIPYGLVKKIKTYEIKHDPKRHTEICL